MSPHEAGMLASLSVVLAGVSLGAIHRLILNQRVRSRLPTQRLSQRLRMPDVRMRFGTLIIAVASTALATGMAVDGIGMAIVFAFLAVTLLVLCRHRVERRRLRHYDQHLLRVLDSVKLSLKSGSGLLTALREASAAHHGAVESDLREVIRQVDLGVRFEDALQVWQERTSLRSVRLTVACIALAYETGGSTAEGIGAVRQTVRNAMVAEDVARTHAAQSQASAFVIAGLPVVASVPMLLFNEPARVFMLHSPMGIALLITGLSLDVVGVRWMSSLIERSQA